MLLKVVSLFLVFMLVMASLQKLLRGTRWGNRLGGPGRRNALDRLRCPTCKRVNMGGRPTACDRADCAWR